MKIDLLQERGGNLAVLEVKKSSRAMRPAWMQLAYYMWRLSQMGIKAKGQLAFPKERKRVTVELTPDLTSEVEDALQGIEKIIQEATPPSANWSRYCRNCAYAEFCWG